MTLKNIIQSLLQFEGYSKETLDTKTNDMLKKYNIYNLYNQTNII